MGSRSQSLNRRLTRAIVSTTAASLLLACAAIIAYDRSTFREAMTGRAETLAEVVGINSAVALSFLDPESATQTLAALSAAEPVVAAVIYDEDGQEFSRYVRDDSNAALPRRTGSSERLAPGHMDVRRPIVFDGAPIGTIVIRWDTGEIEKRTLSFVGIAGALLLASAAVGGVLAARLRRQIARPLAELVETSEAIAEGNLSARVRVSTNDEIGALASTFNVMAEGLGELADQVNQGTRDVGEVARRLEDSSGSLAHQAQRQAVAIEDTSESVTRVGESILGLNAHVEELSESMSETSSSIAEMQASTTEVAGHMDHLASSIDTTSGAVTQVAANNDEVVAGLETLNRATGEAMASLAQLTQSVRLVTKNAQASHDLSEDTSKEAARGLHAVNETTEAMGEISTSFQGLQETIGRLSEKSASIDQVLKAIQGIADATGLLSLNASIIAAQAGEHGKAFSVVADEVSSLAQGTHRSTLEISTLIRAVQEDTASAVSAAAEGAAKVEKGVQRSNVAGEVLALISEKSQHSAARVHEILEASSLQVGDLGKVDAAVAATDQIVEQFARSARDQQRATSEIVSSIENIRDLSRSVRRSMAEQERGAVLITNATADVATLVDRIAESTRLQKKSSESIVDALEIFREVTSATTERVEAINEMVATLSRRAGRLETAVRRLRTEHADVGPKSDSDRRADRPTSTGALACPDGSRA